MSILRKASVRGSYLRHFIENSNYGPDGFRHFEHGCSEIAIGDRDDSSSDVGTMHEAAGSYGGLLRPHPRDLIVADEFAVDGETARCNGSNGALAVRVQEINRMIYRATVSLTKSRSGLHTAYLGSKRAIRGF